eukprot:353090-Chlamydomonas_euryale.AAC.12
MLPRLNVLAVLARVLTLNLGRRQLPLKCGPAPEPSPAHARTHATQASDVHAVHELLQLCWSRRYSDIWAVLQLGVSSWDGSLRPLARALLQRKRAELIEMLLEAYSTIKVGTRRLQEEWQSGEWQSGEWQSGEWQWSGRVGSGRRSGRVVEWLGSLYRATLAGAGTL